jgi:hypothetical protein
METESVGRVLQVYLLELDKEQLCPSSTSSAKCGLGFVALLEAVGVTAREAMMAAET